METKTFFEEWKKNFPTKEQIAISLIGATVCGGVGAFVWCMITNQF